ncbi:hypothetical protein K466DRAFT_239765 [Polyporus arcularius HHB13444]|uniref:Uncharacterized protein n=1 Tax=Polyporus arcularius HHB13444 TaxID=1314778 RepID=A0A5C3P550_9APHY|nr:hypothetical protein K466DRAFT_239765 [Polyporus arcularius HHB13444]
MRARPGWPAWGFSENSLKAAGCSEEKRKGGLCFLTSYHYLLLPCCCCVDELSPLLPLPGAARAMLSACKSRRRPQATRSRNERSVVVLATLEEGIKTQVASIGTTQSVVDVVAALHVHVCVAQRRAGRSLPHPPTLRARLTLLALCRLRAWIGSSMSSATLRVYMH